VQAIKDMTNGPSSTYYAFYRQSVDGGATWTAWMYNAIVSTTLGTNWLTAIQANLGPDWGAYFLAKGPRAIVRTSGTLGALTVTSDTTYFLSNTTTCTLPAAPKDGQRLTFKNKGIFNTTITANAGQTIGTTSSTSFVLYAQEDYVTLEWDGVSIWYVVATNGPEVLTAISGSQASALNATWYNIGALSVTLQPGVYELFFKFQVSDAGGSSTGTIAVSAALSTSNTTPTDKVLMASLTEVAAAGTFSSLIACLHARKIVTLAAATTYYVLAELLGLTATLSISDGTSYGGSYISSRRIG
jgi:hypothetical protein